MKKLVFLCAMAFLACLPAFAADVNTFQAVGNVVGISILTPSSGPAVVFATVDVRTLDYSGTLAIKCLAGAQTDGCGALVGGNQVFLAGCGAVAYTSTSFPDDSVLQQWSCAGFGSCRSFTGFSVTVPFKTELWAKRALVADDCSAKVGED